MRWILHSVRGHSVFRTLSSEDLLGAPIFYSFCLFPLSLTVSLLSFFLLLIFIYLCIPTTHSSSTTGLTSDLYLRGFPRSSDPRIDDYYTQVLSSPVVSGMFPFMSTVAYLFVRGLPRPPRADTYLHQHHW